MNNGSRIAWLLATLLLVAAAGFFAYNAGLHNGVAQGIVQSGKLVAPAPGTVPYPYPYPYPYFGWHRPWGFGLFFPLFFIAFWFVIVRGFFWRRRFDSPYGRRGCGPEGRLDEWHRRAHERWNEPRPEPQAER